MASPPLADFFQPGYAAEADRAALDAEFPGWAVSVSTLGRWYADRREPLEVPGMRPYRPVLGADDARGLRAALASFGA